MTVINTNSLSLLTQNNLNKSQASLGAAIESLSSGLRINSAKDDAAGQAIANRMSSSISGQTVAARNANDGISLAQTAEGALSEINNNLQRIRDLTVQAQNGSNSASDIDSIQSEVNQRMEEIDRVTKQTDFNGNKVLNTGAAAAGKTYNFQVGSDDGQTIGITINSSDSWNLAGAGGLADGTYNTKTMATGTAAQAGANGAAGTAANPGADAVNGVARTVKAEGFDVLHGKVTGGTTGAAAGTSPLSDIDAAIKSVDSQRSLLGASENRFDSTISNLNNAVNNLTSARSRIQDADYSTEVSDMSRAQILQQAGTSVLAKANQVPQSVLSLLQG